VNRLVPRLVIAGVSSGVGKTTVATGLMAALAALGTRVAAAKIGPDFIDPGYHALATGRPGRNLDAWISGREAIGPLAARAGKHADILVIEGVMGLFDGAGDGTASSTADVAKLLDAPVLLVVDASAMSDSVAAMVHGYATFDPQLRVAGVVLNRVGSDGHESMLRDALASLDIPVLGALRRDDSLSWRDRHLGLVPVIEQHDEMQSSLHRLAHVIATSCDLEQIVGLARSAPPHRTRSLAQPRPVSTARIAVPSAAAFSFIYADNLEALQQAGGEIVPFDPIGDPALPVGIDGLYVGGGFPEVFIEPLAANAPLLRDVRNKIAAGFTTWAECGGLLWLARTLDGRPLVGALPADARMTDHLTIGYRAATVRTPNPVAPAGASLRGHEFHYSTVDPPGDALDLTGRHGSGHAGFANSSLLASYLHLHLGAEPEIAERFVAAAQAQPLLPST
jgi:cobyrinic acid a,c-diamide synthase